ncbi:MAG TPA: DUF1232 domain-containing protein [Candidatus Marinimicrobia bacterium]|mgnify:CR=1 FL=1|nr:DUF1232 domain-containing protein [Candidatus Neomarinimicrobiota bacterium]
MPTLHDNYIDSLRGKISNWLASDHSIRNKWRRYIQYTPDLFHLLIKLSADKSISVHCKSKLATAISYFVSPYDFIPEEFWGALGYVDDIALAALVLQCIAGEEGENIVRDNWDGEGDIMALVNEILSVANEMVGKKWLDKLKEMVDS